MIYNIKITDFNDLFNSKIFINLLDTFYVYKLLENNVLQFRKHETKNFITHFIILECFKLFKDSETNKNIIIVQPSVIKNEELKEYCDLTTFCKFVIKILKDLQKTYPCNIIFLKKESDINNPDTLSYVFNKSNKYINPKFKDLRETVEENNLKPIDGISQH